MNNKNKICVYAICKNEKQFVSKWVESMSEADSIVVLDTGSTDGTYEELQKYPNVVVKQQIITPWRFDVARNESLKLVPEDCNILICTDLDELLDKGWAKVLRDNWIDGKHIRGYYKYAWSHDEQGNPGRVFQYDKIHSRDWQWKYPVHEMLVSTNGQDVTPANTINLFDKGVYLHHYPDRTKSRSSYLPLLELREQESPDDYYGLIYLCHEYYYQGLYQKSIDKLKYVLSKYKAQMNSLDEASCYLFMGDDYGSLGLIGESNRCYRKAVQIEPTYREPYIALARTLMTDNMYQEAYDVMCECAKKTYRHYTWLERDTSWTWEFYDVTSLAAYYSGHKKESLGLAVKASYANPIDTRLKNNIQLILDTMGDEDFL